ncbi:hypothetical protein [Leptospira stimsonii]|uniref:DUF1496 domain-containing protein n=1 Tax=Leptospira stimsonii TaxID=2202203 RepID=A0A4R9L1X0_9LEPT|nr:hypothetical protein [Leptospira stimsonii]RHX88162.1 hypothetical protein DLM78_04195 [Leptospira stimsonii]TGK23866.1 hypothetical protein EHO98_04180 [Leptospira stimsonii]TGM10426.1 hypothetical protein EHQ90_18340 [Leptospira stimsonii]
MNLNPRNTLLTKSILLLFFSLPSSGILAQETNTVIKEKMVCQKIELIINGQTYDDGHKCISPEAICYLVEGLSLSCFANPNKDSNATKPKTN